MRHIKRNAIYFPDENQPIDFVATFDTTSRAHYVYKAEKTDRSFKFSEINTPEYYSEMTRLIVKWFDKGQDKITSAHYLTFVDNMSRHGGLKRRGAKPYVDCWFLIAGKVREGFDVQSYLSMFPWVEDDLKAIRYHLDIIAERKLILKKETCLIYIPFPTKTLCV